MNEAKRVKSRLLLAMLGAALIGASASVAACGGSGLHKASTERGASQATAASEPPPTATTTKVIPPGQWVRGDGDADNPSDIDGNGDSDAASVGGPDTDEDAPVPAGYRFPDRDDRQAFAYGHAPGAATLRAVGTVVRRYFAAASAANGAAACVLLEPGLARTVPEDNAGPRDPAYVRGAKSCPEVLARLFAHYHEELAAPVTVYAVRVLGAEAHAIVASRTLPAGSVFLIHRGHAWQLERLLSEPLQ